MSFLTKLVAQYSFVHTVKPLLPLSINEEQQTEYIPIDLAIYCYTSSSSSAINGSRTSFTWSSIHRCPVSGKHIK